MSREPIQIVEIVQPLCSRSFGVSPCTATGTADTKCYNTRATCQDPTNFALTSGGLSLYFSNGNPAAKGVVDYLIPSLVSVSTSPTKLNLTGASPDAQGLGNRALCSVTFADHQHSDRIVDPYVDGRSWNPLDKERSSFWRRWLVRNKYWKNIELIIYEGYAGDALGDMSKRKYFIDSITPPGSSGRITIKGKDILARIEERKAQAPVASPGELYADIDATATSFAVTGAVLADYSATGTLRINDEIMTYTGRSTVTNGVQFTGVTRATDNSEADEHSSGDSVQQCLRYTNETPDDLLADLLTNYGGIDASYLDTATWATEVDTYLGFYRCSTLITEPTAVDDLVSELSEQCLFYVWWDEREFKVKLKAIRGVEDTPDMLTDAGHILADSISLSTKPRERSSRVWAFYDQLDYTKDTEEPSAYRRLFVLADLDSESAEQYQEPAVRKLYCRFLNNDILIQNTATKIIRRYLDIPTQITFRMDAKDRDYGIGDVVQIDHYFDVDQYGERRLRLWTITSAEEVIPGEVVKYTAEDTSVYSTIHYVMASGAADYPGYDVAPAKNCYIGDSSGLLSDGETAGLIS